MSYARPEATPLRKIPNFWILAAVTYAIVIVVTILAVFVYKKYWPNASANEIALEQKSARITVGSVWMPVYPGALHQDATASTKGDVTEGDLFFTSNDPPQKVLAFYRAHLQRARFNVLFRRSDDGGRIQAFGNKGKSVATLTASATPQGSQMQIHTRAVEGKQ